MEEGRDDVKSSWPLWAGLHTCYNGGDKEMRSREAERICKKPSQFGLHSATRVHEVGIASNRGTVLGYRCSKTGKMWSPSSRIMVEAGRRRGLKKKKKRIMVETIEQLPPSEVWAESPLGIFGHSVIGRVIS